MKHLIASIALLSAILMLAPTRTESAGNENKVVFLEEGRFAGWPANQGIWNWGDEIVVGFSLGYYKENPEGGHAIDREKPSGNRQARSLDGGETWTVEVPSYLNAQDEEADPVELEEGIDFSNPNLAVKFRSDRFYFSPDRCKTWKGPFQLPDFGREKLLSRTDYLIEGKDRLTAFIAASKDNGKEGQPLCIRTGDGGKTWENVGWICKQPAENYGYAIMPSTVKLKNDAYLCMIRRAGEFDGERRWWIEPYLSPDEGASWYALEEPIIDNGGNPPSMIRLADGRIALTYGWRHAPYGIRARISEDEGQTWSKEIILRSDGADWDLGYPRTVQREDGRCVTVYYYHHPDQPERFIGATIWEPMTPED
jgi:hypothetical protein